MESFIGLAKRLWQGRERGQGNEKEERDGKKEGVGQ
jgi:hypothetical protein